GPNTQRDRETFRDTRPRAPAWSASASGVVDVSMAVPLPVSSCRTPNSDEQAGVRRETATSNFHDFWDNSEGETAMIETELNGRFDPFDPAFCNDPFPFYRSLVN